ncbi:hypothetical protein GCM10010331_17150 [Streptomyces xanthochromogenes]|nr:hypothetical protein GCM10010331_17150 [Streptomyces xanthochromogenes]
MLLGLVTSVPGEGRPDPEPEEGLDRAQFRYAFGDAVTGGVAAEVFVPGGRP